MSEKKETTRRRGKGYQSYASYLGTVLRQVQPDASLSGRSVLVLDGFLDRLHTLLATKAAHIARTNKRATINYRDVVAATKLVLPGQIAMHAVSESAKALNAYRTFKAVEKEDGRKGNTSRSARANLKFPVGRIDSHTRAGLHARRLGSGAPIALTAVLEYLAAEILEISGDAAKDNKKRRITPRHIQLAVGADHELSRVFRNTTIVDAGVNPHINPALLKQKKGKKATEEL